MKTKIAILTNTLSGGGMERAIVNIANQLASEGYNVDLLLAKCKGILFDELSKDVRVICLNEMEKFSKFELLKIKGLGKLRFQLLLWAFIGRVPKALKCIKPIRDYISDVSPSLILSTPMTANIALIKATELSNIKPIIILREASTLSEEKTHSNNGVFKKITEHVTECYSKANKVICVSKGVKKDLIDNYEVESNNCLVIRNPIDEELIVAKSKEIDGYFDKYDSKEPFILALGRLEEQKDFITLIKAFSKASNRINQNLLILGEGTQREKLESLVREYHLTDRVFMPGFVKNPYPYIANCDLFVLSSRWEGLANVLREAMVFEKKIVATDCPSGTKEILAPYNKGKIIPINDISAMSVSIVESINSVDDTVHVNEFELSDVSLDYLSVIKERLSILND